MSEDGESNDLLLLFVGIPLVAALVLAAVAVVMIKKKNELRLAALDVSRRRRDLFVKKRPADDIVRKESNFSSSSTNFSNEIQYIHSIPNPV